MPADREDKPERPTRLPTRALASLIVVCGALLLAAGIAGCGGSTKSSCEVSDGCIEDRRGVEEPVDLAVEALPRRPVAAGSATARAIEAHEKECEGGGCLALAPLDVATSIAGTIAEESEGGAEDVAESGSGTACPLTATRTIGAIPMQMPDCLLVASDTSSDPQAEPFWGELQCAAASRYSAETSGGDPSETAAGRPQDNADFRRLTVLDGDDFSGERCELGENNNEGGPTVFYHQGEHLVTYFSEKLPENFPLDTETWQTVMQMKQAQPSDNGGNAPIIEMEARQDKWVVVDDWHELWTFPAAKETWTRFAWDVYYSTDPDKGRMQVSVDLNGDGDFEDPGERSPTFHLKTLKTEIEGPNGSGDGLVPGDPLPSHLRMGIYHDPAIPCPAPRGCSTDVDNVQVFAPSPLQRRRP